MARFHIIVLVALCFTGRSVEAAEYSYPYRDPYIATATTVILNDDRLTPPQGSATRRDHGVCGFP